MSPVVVVLLVLAAVLTPTVLLGVVALLRRGRPRRRTAKDVEGEVREELVLSTRDWWAVRQAVAQGKSAPEPLRPVAHLLADRLVRHDEASRWHPSRGQLVAGTVLLYLAIAGVWTAVAGPGWSALLRPLTTVGLAVLIVSATNHRRRRTLAARDANEPAVPR